MMYKIFNGGDWPGRKRATPQIKLPKARARTEHLFANFLIGFIKFILFIYDIVSLPIYFVLQRPDKRAAESQRTWCEQVDANTWTRTDQNSNGLFCGLHKSRSSKRLLNNNKRQAEYMGATLNEMFANAIQQFESRKCLGYRAVITCPVLNSNEKGQHVLQDKSFRSDYTWYTYGQIGRRVQEIASGLYFHSIYPNSRALFLANTSLEWFCAAQACFQLGVLLVLTPEIDDKGALHFIIDESETDFIFASCDRLSQLCQLLDTIKAVKSDAKSRIKKIIIIDWQFSVDFNEKTFAQLGKSSDKTIEVLSMGQIEEAGVENPIEVSCSKTLNNDSLNQVSQTADRRNGGSGSNYTELPRRVIARKLKSLTNLHEACHNDKQGWSIESNSLIKTTYRVEKQENTEMRTSATPRDLAMIVYTYGSLGQIKPIMLTHYNISCTSHNLFLDNLLTGGGIHCAIISLDTIIEFMTEICIFNHGGSIGYSCNLKTLFYDGSELFKGDKSDLEALNPSFLLVRPYILEQLRSSIHNYLQFKLNPLISFTLINVLFEYKKYWASRHFETPIVDRLFCSYLKRLFGANLKYILCKGGTDCSETKDFFAFMLNVPVIELYGPDEAIVSLVSVNDNWDYKRQVKSHKRVAKKWSLFQDESGYGGEKLDDFKGTQSMPKVDKNTFREDRLKNLQITSSILCPTIGTKIRLEDWEDFQIGDQPYPRGRLVIGGDSVCVGYLKWPKMAENSFYTDSNYVNWFRTGDIACAFPNGTFEVISAMSDMIRMADGQFISLIQVEHILRNSQFVDNVCTIWGEDRRFVINLVVPNIRHLALMSPGGASLKMAIGMEPKQEELNDLLFRREVCNDRLLCEFVSENLSKLIAKAGLGAIPNRFLMVPEIWTPESELVTTSFEPKRSAIEKFYATEIQSILRMESRSSGQNLFSRRVRSKESSSPTDRVIKHHS